jgi:hypothetical protein
MGANYGPTSQLRAKKNKMGNFGLFLWATLASLIFFFFKDRKLVGMVVGGS